MKITTMFWYLWSTPLVFSVPRRRLYDAAKLEIKQDSKAHDASINLPHQPPTAPVFKDTAVYKLLPRRLSMAQLKDPEVDTAHRRLQQKPLRHPASKDDAAYELVPLGSPTAPASKDDAAYQLLPPKSRTAPSSENLPGYEFIETMKPHSLSSELSDDTYEQKAHAFSAVSDDYYEDKNLPNFDEDNEDSLYPGVFEEYLKEEEVTEANDDSELTDDFLSMYLSNEDLDIEIEEEASDG